jgi:DNA-binding NtrC family response regulator
MAQSPLRQGLPGRPSPVPPSSKFGSGTHAVGRAKIPLLVVDADPHVHDGVSAALVGGFDVYSAFVLTQAAPLVEIKRPRVVLLSVEFDPAELFIFSRYLRHEFRGTILIASTRAGQVKDATRAMDLGARAFVEKPVEPGRLLRLLGKQFG